MYIQSFKQLIVWQKDLYRVVDFLRTEGLLTEIQKMLITMINKLGDGNPKS